MVKEEIIQRLFYVDNKYHNKGLRDKNPEQVKEIFTEIKNIVLAKSLNEIKKELFDNSHFIGLGNQPYGKLIDVNVSLLRVDLNHTTEFLNAPVGTPLEFIASNLNKDKKTAKRVKDIQKIVKVLLEERPSIVRKNKEIYEVLMGNHTLISLIKDGHKICKVLCICNENEAQDYPDLKFY